MHRVVIVCALVATLGVAAYWYDQRELKKRHAAIERCVEHALDTSPALQERHMEVCRFRARLYDIADGRVSW